MTPSGRTDTELLVDVARRFYLQDLSKVEIAKAMGISRFKVARLLETARERGIVRIDIAGEPELDRGLSEDLVAHLGVDSALVLRRSSTDTETTLRRDIGAVAARELERLVGPDDVLGLPWSRGVAATVAQLRRLPQVPIVQLSGALAVSGVETPVDVVRAAANIGHGSAHHFYAPLVAADAASAVMLRSQPGVVDALAHVADVTVGVVGVGGGSPGLSTLYDLATDLELAELDRCGAIGEISGVFIDRRGAAVGGGLADRIITVSPGQLKAVRDVIALATDPRRAPVVSAAVHGGLINRLVVDAPLAEALLA